MGFVDKRRVLRPAVTRAESPGLVNGRDDPGIVPMDAKEAGAKRDRILRHLKMAGHSLLELKERRGWEALGYETWEACIEGEFSASRSYVYRQLEAAETRRDLSPIGDITGLKEGTLRPLSGLTPEEKRSAFAAARKGSSKVTAKLVRETVGRMRAAVAGSEADWTVSSAPALPSPGGATVFHWGGPSAGKDDPVWTPSRSVVEADWRDRLAAARRDGVGMTLSPAEVAELWATIEEKP